MAIEIVDRARSRRALLFGGLAGLGVLAARSLGAPDRTDAADAVQLGVSNSETSATVMRNISTGSGSIGTVGRAAASGGVGLQGIAEGSNGKGVYGYAGTGSGAMGVYGAATQGHGVQGYGVIGVVGNGTAWGVYGNSGATSGIGVNAIAANGIGVNATSPGGTGVQASGGVYGVDATATIDGGSGVYGTGNGASGNGVVGIANVGSSAYGIWGLSSSGYAGVFSGNVLVAGTLSKAAGSFQIDHPLDPENRYLFHSFVESPDMMNVYNGNVTLDAAGRATVQLPRYFEALNQDFRYQLTPIGGQFVPFVAEEIKAGRFTIAGGEPGLKVSWQVTGIRRDPYANAHRIKVEPLKPRAERGTYLHPEVWGQPAAKGFQAKRLRALSGRGR